MVPNPQNRGAVLPTDLLFIQANILIDEGGHARLADFGLLVFISDPTNTTITD